MTGTRDLDKPLFYHAVLGALFALLLFCAMLLSGYRDSLADAEDSMVRIRRNLVAMDSAREDLRGKRELVASIIPARRRAKSNRELMLVSLENARARIPGAKLTVTGFTEENGELVLPVVFEFPVVNYNDALKTVGFLEEMALPYFSPTGLTIVRVEGTGNVEGRIEGSLRMPDEKAGGADEG
jgi:hypothetical protein